MTNFNSSASPVVKVLCTSSVIPQHQPWITYGPRNGSGSACVVKRPDGLPKVVLTNAHVVKYHSDLRLQKSQQSQKHDAMVLALSHARDLALISTKDGFLDDIEPAVLEETIPDNQPDVTVAGYAMAGNNIATTRGTIARVSENNYSHSGRRLLTIQVDAAINPGNSGGAAFLVDRRVNTTNNSDSRYRMIGLSFQSMSLNQGNNHLIPVSTIKAFLREVDKALAPNPKLELHLSVRDFDVPSLGIVIQTMENEALREIHGLNTEDAGVRVKQIDYGSSTHGLLEPSDVITSFDGKNVNNEGKIKYQSKHLVSLLSVLGDYSVGDSVNLEVVRNGKRMALDVVLKAPTGLVPTATYSRPQYFHCGGIMLQALNKDFLRSWGSELKSPIGLQVLRSQRSTEAQQEVIVISSLLNHDINRGYEGLVSKVISTINGKQPATLDEAHQLIKEAKAKSPRLRLTTSDNAEIVFRVGDLDRAEQEIDARYKVTDYETVTGKETKEKEERTQASKRARII